MDNKNILLMNHTSKVMVAMMEKIKVKECIDCKRGKDGVPNCKSGDCDLPIELYDEKLGKIGVVISNLKGDKWDFQFEDKTCDIYYLFGFDAEWNEILHLWKIPKKDMLEHLEFHM